VGTPRQTLTWLTASSLATGVPLRPAGALPARVLRDPDDGAVRVFEESDHAVLWLVADEGAPRVPDLVRQPFHRMTGRREVDVAGEVMVISSAGGDDACLWIDPPGCPRVAATREPVVAPVRADAAPRIARVREARSLAHLCDALQEGGNHAFVLRSDGSSTAVIVGEAPRGRWSIPGPDAAEGALEAIAALPRRVPLLCLAGDRSPWAALQTSHGGARVTLVYPLPPGGVETTLDGELASRLPALLDPARVGAPFTPWNEAPAPVPWDGFAGAGDRVGWEHFAAHVAAAVRAQGERIHASDVATLALEHARRRGLTVAPGAAADLLHALALSWHDESLSATVAAAELVSVLAHVGRQRLSTHAVARATRAATRGPCDPRDDGQLPELVRVLRVQTKTPPGDLDACAAMGARLAKDKRFKAMVVVARVAAALAPSRGEVGGRVVALDGDDVVTVACAREHALWFAKTAALPDDEQVAERVLEYAPQVLPALRAQAGNGRRRALEDWLDVRFPRAWSDASQAALRG